MSLARIVFIITLIRGLAKRVETFLVKNYLDFKYLRAHLQFLV